MKIRADNVEGRIYIDSETGSQLIFSLFLYKEGRMNIILASGQDPFTPLNQFIATLEPHKQNQLWNFYKDCRLALDELADSDELEQRLNELMIGISKDIPMQSFKSWYDIHSHYPIPEGIKDSLEEMDDPSTVTRVQTYLKPDYRGLCALSLSMSLFAPVFSAFVNLTKGFYGTAWKTYRAYKLIEGTTYYQSEYYNRLYEYTEATVACLNPGEGVYDAIIMAGMSREEFPKWVMGVIITKKVALGDITGNKDVSPLIVLIHKYIHSRVKGVQKQLKTNIKYRDDGSSNAQTDESTMAKLEAYSARSRTTENKIAIAEYYLRDPMQVAKKIDPSITKKLIKEAMVNREMLMSGLIEDGQIILTKWIISKVIPPRLLDYLDRSSVVNAIIASRALLYHWGFHDLAFLVSAVVLEEEIDQISSYDKKSRVVGKLAEEVETLYPFYRKTTGRKDNRPVYPLQTNIELLENKFSMFNWKLTVDKSWLDIDYGNGVYLVEGDLKVSLTKLAVFLNTVEVTNPDLDS